MTDLNERQRAYLLAALKVDQDTEAYHQGAFQRGNFDESRRPASDWRAMPFGRWNNMGHWVPTALRRECEQVSQVDEGSGSTWAALAGRGLVTVQDRGMHGLIPVQVLPHVTLTAKGRKLARDLSGAASARRPRGAYSRSTWRALAAGYKAGTDGLWDEGGGSWYGGISWDVWLMLVRQTKHREPWFDEITRAYPKDDWRAGSRSQYGVRITTAGSFAYIKGWEVNHALYPDIEAPAPAGVLPKSNVQVEE